MIHFFYILGFLLANFLVSSPSGFFLRTDDKQKDLHNLSVGGAAVSLSDEFVQNPLPETRPTKEDPADYNKIIAGKYVLKSNKPECLKSQNSLPIIIPCVHRKLVSQ